MRQSRLRLEIHRDAVDAVPQMGRRRAVGEDMAEVAAAAAAMDLGAPHAVAVVERFLDCTGLWVVEARPAGAALELGLRHEQFLPAAGTRKRARALLIIERAASRRLGAMLAHDVELFGRE